jgi:hypothetical protein
MQIENVPNIFFMLFYLWVVNLQVVYSQTFLYEVYYELFKCIHKIIF